MLGLAKVTDKLGMPIDKGIVETVAALNVNGFPTIQSCAGHLAKRFGVLQYDSPWVHVGFRYPKKRFVDEEKIKEMIEKEYGMPVKYTSEPDAAEMAYWKYLSKNKPPETPEYLERREMNKALTDKCSLLLQEFYVNRSTQQQYKLITGRSGHAFWLRTQLAEEKAPIDPDNRVDIIDREQALASLRIEQTEMKAFGKFLKDKFFSEE